MQGQRIPDAVRYVLVYLNFPCLNIDPVAVFLINDLIMQIEKSADAVVLHVA